MSRRSGRDAVASALSTGLPPLFDRRGDQSSKEPADFGWSQGSGPRSFV
jgi:hypothetical protein